MRVLLLALALTGAFGAAAPAQDYPDRPITLIVPTVVGGGNDAIARALAASMSQSLGEAVVPENQGGAGGTIATRDLARSAPDGYTIGIGNSGTMAMGPWLYPNAGYSPRRDFAPIGLIASSTVVLAVNAAVPATSVQELIALAKRAPGKLTYGTGGAGSPGHLFTEMFADRAGIKLTHVPFRGLGPAMNNLIGGHITMVFGAFSVAMPHIQAGAIRGLATTGETRAKEFPDLPTMAEAGLPGYTARQSFGLLAPAGTPEPIVDKLNAALRLALESDRVKEQLAADGAVALPGTPEDYARDIEREEAMWATFIRGVEPIPK